uniref:Zgc:153681 n=1 Tax=Sinocyclocheilus grahami TaxID=75366 RepID=A0A672MPF9_SINGR
MTRYRAWYPNLSVISRVCSSSSDPSGSAVVREVVFVFQIMMAAGWGSVKLWGSIKASLHRDSVRVPHRGAAPGRFRPGPHGRFQDGSVDVSVMGSHIPYGCSSRREEERMDKIGGGNTQRFRAENAERGGENWFKITIPYGKIYDKKWLLTSLQNLCPIAFIPLYYSTEGHKVYFCLEDAAAASALFKLTRRVTDSEGNRVVVFMNCCSSPPFLQSELKPQDLERLKHCMSKRFDGSQKSLDLNSIHIDPGKTILNNKLCKLNDIAELVNTTPNLQSQNLSHNEVRDAQATASMCVLLLVNVKFLTGCVCVTNSGHFVSNEIQGLIQRFLQHYYCVYDSGDRQPLLEAYHEGACFSLSLPSINHPSRCKLKDYHEHSRNIKHIKDPFAFLNELPKTQHDMNSVNVDVNTCLRTLLTFTVSGVFKEGESCLNAVICVSITVDQVALLCIVNDELFVRNTTSEETRCAFAALALAPSISSVLPTLTASQQEMLSAFSQKSEMNLEWSQKT